MANKDKLKGGKADKREPSSFDSKAVAEGAKVEREHTEDKETAKEIARDHLEEDPKYYPKLEGMEAPISGMEEKILKFLEKNPKPEDSAVHAFAGKLGINKHKFEEMIYALLAKKAGVAKKSISGMDLVISGENLEKALPAKGVRGGVEQSTGMDPVISGTFKNARLVVVEDFDPLPSDIALMVFGSSLEKSAAHKYIRRVPYTDSSGKKRYRYYYNVTGGKGIGSVEDIQVGAKFRVKDIGEHVHGHLTVQSVDGNLVVVEHDESGKTYKMTRRALSALIQRHHLKDIKAARTKAEDIANRAKEHGSVAQKERSKAKLENIELKFEDVFGEKKKQKPLDGSRSDAAPQHRAATKVKKRRKSKREKIYDELQRRKLEDLGVWGNTYPHYSEIKEAGGIWDQDERAWYLPDEKSKQEITDLMKAAARKRKREKEKVLDEKAKRRKAGFIVSGNTYAYKDEIKDAGGMWDPDRKVWLMPDQESTDQLNAKTNPGKPKNVILPSRTEEQVKKQAGPVDPELRKKVEALAKEVDADSRNKLGVDFGVEGDEVWSKISQSQAETLLDALEEVKRLGYIPPSKKTWSISVGSGNCSGPPFAVGDVLDHPKLGIVVVTATSKKYFAEDGMSFGVGADSGYIYFAKVRAPTQSERREFLGKKAAAQVLSSQKKRVRDIGAKIRKDGEFLRGDNVVEGTRVFDTQNAYGGGNWFVLSADGATVWFVQNNGADGDYWGDNNIRTGGAGALGWKVVDKALHAEIAKLAREMEND